MVQQGDALAPEPVAAAAAADGGCGGKMAEKDALVVERRSSNRSSCAGSSCSSGWSAQRSTAATASCEDSSRRSRQLRRERIYSRLHSYPTCLVARTDFFRFPASMSQESSKLADATSCCGEASPIICQAEVMAEAAHIAAEVAVGDAADTLGAESPAGSDGSSAGVISVLDICSQAAASIAQLGLCGTPAFERTPDRHLRRGLGWAYKAALVFYVAALVCFIGAFTASPVEETEVVGRPAPASCSLAASSGSIEGASAAALHPTKTVVSLADAQVEGLNLCNQAKLPALLEDSEVRPFLSKKIRSRMRVLFIFAFAIASGSVLQVMHPLRSGMLCGAF